MEIITKEIQGLDFFIVLVLNKIESETTIEKIKNSLHQWCNDAIDGKFGGHMHFIHSLDYYSNKNFIYVFIDMGTMNPEIGFNELQSICLKINEEEKQEIINHIEIDGTDEILEMLNPYI